MASLSGTGTSNGTGVGAYVSSYGFTSLWIGFAVTLFAAFVFFVLSYIRNVKPEALLTYYLVTVINAITALAYLAMAFGPVWVAHNSVRQFEWIRYAAWVAVAPVTIWILGLLSGAHWVDIFWVSFATIISVGALFAAAISPGFNATWPIFAFGLFAGIVVAIAIVFTFRRAAYKVHREIGKLFDVVGFGSLLAYVAYAITWGVSEGGFITTVDQEIIIYTTLDIFTKVVFGFVLIWSREAIARYGSFLGQVNTGIDFDFPIARSTYTSSGSNYVTQPSPAVVLGEHRDLAFAQLHTATNTGLTSKLA
jgi:bacteriorhodopsin